MELIPRDSFLFRAAVDALKDFLPLAQVRCSADGIRISGMDSSHVGFVDYFLAAADCEKLSIPSPFMIGVNMTVLARVLAPVGSGDRVTLSIGKKPDTLSVVYLNEKMAKKSSYELALFTIDGDVPELPDTTYGATLRARTSDISALVKEIAYFGDAIQLRLDEDGFHVATGGDAGTVSLTLENTEGREMELAEDAVSVSFAMKYFSNILKGGGGLSAMICLEFDSTQPLKAGFAFTAASYFNAYLAPVVVDA